MDCTFRTPQGNFNYRVGAIIRRGDKLYKLVDTIG